MSHFRLLHWNIKECDGIAISSRSAAFCNAVGLISHQQPDLLSLNEVEYGPQSPSPYLDLFLEAITPDPKSWHQTFYAANSGQRAKPLADGTYLRFHEELSPEQREYHLDQANYGLFPGQFSIGLASRFPIEDRLLIRDLPWKSWDPHAPLAQLDLGGMSAEDFPLFDKSFQVSWCRFEERVFAVITLHCVPAFDFGSKFSPNVLRNAAQLEFLAWYLTGVCPEHRCPPEDIRALDASMPFLAVGDFNIALDAPHAGAKVLRSLLAHPRVQARVSQMPSSALQGTRGLKAEHTFFSSGWDTSRKGAQLDYILVSQDFVIERLETLMSAPDLQEHGLFLSETAAQEFLARHPLPAGRRYLLTSTQNPQGQPLVRVRSAAEDFVALRTASDHLPLVLEARWA